MANKTSLDKIERARQLEADGVERVEIGRIVGLSAPTLIKWLGKKPRIVTVFVDCVCGDHAFATIEPGHATLIDRGDVPRYSNVKLFLLKSTDKKQKALHPYVVRSGWPHAHVRIHREIMAAVTGELVDHESRNTLDNRRSNLRKATRSGNGANSRGKGGSSRFKGVHLEKRRSLWAATIQVHREKRWIGYFKNEIAAAKAYDAAAIDAFGAFAQTNRMLGLL